MISKEVNGVGHLIITVFLMIFLGVMLILKAMDTATAMTALGFALGYWYRTSQPSSATVVTTTGEKNVVQ